MKILILAMLGFALAGPLAGCSTPVDTATTATGGTDWSFDTGSAGAGVTMLFGEDIIVVYAEPKTPTEVVDYVIQDAKTLAVVYHVESALSARSFRIEIDRLRLKAATYHMKVYADKATTPFDERDVTVK